MNKIKCKQDKVFTTSDKREFTQEDEALAHQRELNFNDTWKHHWNEGMTRRYRPWVSAAYGTGFSHIYVDETKLRDYLLQNKSMIMKMYNQIDTTEIEYETK